MDPIVKNSQKIHENMINLVEVLYYFCHNNFMPEPGETHGKLTKYPFFPALMTAIGALVLDASYDPPIFEANEDLKNKFFWLYTNCDWIAKKPQTPYFYRCLSYKPPKRVKSQPFDPEVDDEKISKVCATAPFDAAPKAQVPDEEKWEELLAFLTEKVETHKRRKQC